MLLTRKTDYALVALAGLARPGRPASSARDLAAELNLPLPVLRNILKLLASRGLLTSSRGPSGGYRLARHPREITLAAVVDAIEGPVQLLKCCPIPGGDDDRCRLEPSCLIKDRVRMVHERLMQFLNEVTLDQIAPDAADGDLMGAGTAIRLRTATPTN